MVTTHVISISRVLKFHPTISSVKVSLAAMSASDFPLISFPLGPFPSGRFWIMYRAKEDGPVVLVRARSI